MLARMTRPCAMAATTDGKASSRSTMSAASRAACVPRRPIAMPMSARPREAALLLGPDAREHVGARRARALAGRERGEPPELGALDDARGAVAGERDPRRDRPRRLRVVARDPHDAHAPPPGP